MIVIVDNGKGANEISQSIRMQNSILKPSEAASSKARAYILSDGDLKNQAANIKIIKAANGPVLGIGTGCMFIGAMFGAKIKKVAKKRGVERLSLKKPCPLTLDLKRVFAVMEDYQSIFSEVPENFSVVASSRVYDFEIVQEAENPFFGVQFNPELGGDGRRVLMNFERFVEVWDKYHK
jgi:GMP synthase-like glutamine amidotransferase